MLAWKISWTVQSLGSQNQDTERLSLCGFPGGSDGKASACNVGDLGSIPGLDHVEKEMATHPSALA